MALRMCVFCVIKLLVSRPAVGAARWGIRTPTVTRSFGTSAILARAGGTRRKRLFLERKRSRMLESEAKRESKRESRNRSVIDLITPGPRQSVSRDLMRDKLAVALGIVRPHREKLDDPYYADHLPEGADIAEMLEKFPKYEERILKLYHPDTIVDAADPGVLPPRLLEATYERKGLNGLARLLYDGYMSFLGYKPESYEAKSVRRREISADTRYPQEWYTQTRQYRRVWHLHVGPTNSGKTYHALKRLEATRNGIYAGPLRLLAYEVYERMNAKGIACDLVTGDDIRITGDEAMIESSTMEMVDFSKEVEICVIDEIQMIGDKERGWAWTQAVLGVRAREVHMCGEERAVDIIQELADTIGDKLIIHRYKRLGPLEVLPHSLKGDLKKLEPGDCIVTFSRRNIFALKTSIERTTGRRCAVIYGSLPPEVRSAQARLFNDPNSEYEILVASDAIGMGLNLSIKRVIFESMLKFDGTRTVSITVPQAKQIAGRAGRFKTASAVTAPTKPGKSVAPRPAAPQVGYVTTLDKSDHKALRKAMETEPTRIKTAGILPLVHHVAKFAAQFPPDEKFSTILRALRDEFRASDLFHTCSFDEQLSLAKVLDDVNLSVAERMIMLMAPISSDPTNIMAAKHMARCIADGADGSVLKIPQIDIEALDKTPKTKDDLRGLERLHKALIMYLWLSYRFPVTFTPRQTALELKAICEASIEEGLKAIKFTRRMKKPFTQPIESVVLEPSNRAQSQITHEPEEIEEIQEDPNPDYKSLRQYLTRRPTVESMWCYNCGLRGHLSARCPNEKKKMRHLPEHVRKEMLAKLVGKAQA